MKISASMIVKNEESCLARCLASIQGLDEIVVVDTGSTDRTIEIARAAGATVYAGEEFLWRDDFAFSRNQSLERCTGDWILIVDADEVLESSVSEVRAACARATGDSIFFQTICAKARGEVHPSIRLFRKASGITWQGRIHNYLSESEAEDSDLAICYGYSKAHEADPDRALRILTKVVAEDPECKRERFYLAREHWYRNDYATAAREYEEYLKRAVWAPEMADAQLMLARCYWYLQQGEKARAACLQAIKINTNFEEALLFMADMSGPVNSKRWRQFAATASNEHLLFKRQLHAPPVPTEQEAGVYRPHADQAVGVFAARPGCQFSEGVAIDATGDVAIGDHCLFLRRAHIHTHRHAFFYGDVPDVTREHGITPTPLTIGHNVVIAEDALIMAGVGSIGDNAVIGANAVLTHAVGPGEVWAGNPARLIGHR